MKAVIKFLAALAFVASAPFANAAAIGALWCPECTIPSSGITNAQIDALVKFANDTFPSNFQPSNNDVVDVCNGHYCYQVKYDSVYTYRWEAFRGAVGVSTDNYWSTGKNYINVSAAGKSGSGGSSGIQRSPGGSNMQITTSGHWEGVVWSYNGVPYQINWMFVLDYASWSSSDNPNPYVFEAN